MCSAITMPSPVARCDLPVPLKGDFVEKKENIIFLGFELDVHWIWRAGLNPIDIIPRYANRIRAIHLKDYRVGEINILG